MDEEMKFIFNKSLKIIVKFERVIQKILNN